MGISALVDQQKMPLPASQSKSHQSLFEVFWLQQTPRKYVKNEIETLFLDVLVGCLEKVKNIFSQKMVWWPSDCCLRKKNHTTLKEFKPKSGVKRNSNVWNYHQPASSKWPFDSPNGGHLAPEKVKNKTPKKVTNGRTWKVSDYSPPCFSCDKA